MTERDELFQVHDELFHSAFATPEAAAPLLASIVGPELSSQIDWSTLEAQPTKFTSPYSPAKHSDVLFKAKASGQDMLIYVLMEHQSSNEVFMLARLLLYMGLIWNETIKNEKPSRYLPPILPVVVHHSESGWTAATSFEELVTPEALAVPGLAAYVPKFEVVLDDLSKATDEQLLRRGLALMQVLALWVLRDARNPKRFFQHLRDTWHDLLNQLAADPSQVRAAQMIMSYIARVLGAERAHQLRQELAQLAPAAENAMQSIADSWKAEGRAEGIEKGQRNLVERQLAKKFGSPLPPEVLERLGAATLEQLEQYADRVLDAKQLSDVFDSLG